MFIAGEEKGTSTSDTRGKDYRRYSSDNFSDGVRRFPNVFLLPLQELHKRTSMRQTASELVNGDTFYNTKVHIKKVIP